MAESTLDLEDRVDKILRSDYKLVAKAFLTKCSKDSASSMEREKGSEFFKYPDAVNRVQEVKRIPVMAFRPALEAKLRELLHKISSQEIKLCSEAAKEFSKLLKGETGGDLLRLYFNSSPDFPVELLEAWKLRHGGKRGPSCIFPLIKTILSHPEGRSRSTEIGRAIDEFCGLLIREKLDDICTVLNINEEKQQNAALSLLATMVRRGPHMGSEIANKFHFKGFAKLGEYKKQRRTRRRFVAFAISFLEVGKPGFLRSVLKQKEMYSIVLQGLGNDDEDTVASVLSTLKDKILVLDQSKVSPGLRRALFGDLTLKQLASITAREDDGIVNELAHDVLVKVCTDPSNGLMPDAKRKLIGASGRLLRLMKRLRTIDSCYHSDLLLAIVRGRPSFASAFLDEFPYNVEDIASPSWSSSISLAANLVSSVRLTCSFDFLNPDQRATPPSAGSDVQTIMKCVCPRPFSRSLITKGMLHSDSLVKGGTLRFLSETLKLWDSFVTAWKLCSPHSCPGEQIQASLERDVMGEARSFFPDPQVLLTVLNSLGGSSGTQKVSLKRKRKAVLDSGLVDRKRFKRPEKDGDIVMNVVGSDKDIFSADAQMTDQADAQMVDQADAGKEALLINLLDDLRIYMHSGLSGLDGSFDVFMKLLSSSSGLPAELQRALLSVLKEYISWTPKLQIERVPSRIPPLMFKHLDVFMNLLLFSSDDEVKDLAKDLAVVAMSSTGAFDKNRSEIGGWFLFLPGYQNLKAPRKVQEGVESMSSVVISFLCDAVSTVGNHLFTQWDIVRSILSHLEGVSIGFSPLIRCILQKCVSLLNKEFAKHSLEEKTAISLYVCSTLKSLLQTQVDSKPLSCLVQSVLSKDVDGSKDSCEWRPLRMLLLFSQSLSENKPFILHSRQTTGGRAKASFAKTLGKIKERVRSISPDYIPEVVKEFSSALICATPASLLKNFASVMAVSWAFYGTSFSFLQSIAFLEVNFLGNLLKQSPGLFVQGSELTVSRIEGGTVDSEIDFADHSSITEEITSKMDTHDIESSVFFMVLEQAPFHVLLNAVMIMDNKKLSKRMSKLLLLKAAQPKSDSIKLDINSILFWLSQIRSAYEVLPARVLCQRSEICLSVMNPLFSQISERNLVSGPSSDKLLVPFANLVAQTVLCHPVVMALVESPLDCGTLPPVQC
ncbi:unnamed protein product [Arabis nemorensis]|uniref:URB1 N-terminal domain-containing protein n=1 Tax=Arabis nemorensis TaxID=586526 RepID=A0A565BDB3_9BRAS|nr:unnamed protein product [Arabis nemorensis]